MIDKKDLLKRIVKIENLNDRQDFKSELINIFQGMKEVGQGFLKIAKAADKIKVKKYYKEIGFDTFEVFCQTVIGLTRKTVNLYLRVNSIMEKYPDLFPEEYVMQLGSAKMEKLISGILKIEEYVHDNNKKNELIKNIISQAEPNKSVGQIEDLVNNFVKRI